MISKGSFPNILLRATVILAVLAFLGVMGRNPLWRGMFPRLSPSVMEAGIGLPSASFRQEGGKENENSGREISGKRDQESKLVLGKGALSQARVIRFPIQFTAAAGETVGAIRAQIIVPAGGAKFLKFEPLPGFRLKVSVRQARQEDRRNGEGQARQTLFTLSISAGSSAIRDGLIGHVQFSLAKQETPPAEPPVARILQTSPPETEQILTAPSVTPPALPGDAPVNPAVSCFFFSH